MVGEPHPGTLFGVTLQASGQPRAGAELLGGATASPGWTSWPSTPYAQARFVSKSDVKAWPVLGTLVAVAHAVHRAGAQARCPAGGAPDGRGLRGGQTVGIFPEGTTSDGRARGLFMLNSRQAAIATEVPIQAVALRYWMPLMRSAVPWPLWANTTLVQDLWVACAEQLSVRVQVLGAQSVAHADRRRLAERLTEEIGTALGGSIGGLSRLLRR